MLAFNESLVGDLIDARCARPFDLLGFHDNPSGSGKVLRVWRPDATSVTIVRMASGESAGKMKQIRAGLFELPLDGSQPFPYQLRVTNNRNESFDCIDPYQFARHVFSYVYVEPYRSYRYMGGQLVSVPVGSHQSVTGVMFRVYAPNARSVSVIGSFNGWDGRMHPMGSSGDGIWRLFMPQLEAGALYKFEIRNQQGDLLPHKADPYGFYAEQPPGNASIVYDHSRYDWQDRSWRHHAGHDRPISIYEVHLGSWKRHPDGSWLSYRELSEQLVPYVRELGFTHIELLPVMEHPFSGSWGYQLTGLFATTSRFGSPDDFKFFVDTCHLAGLGVILDWVPAHFPSDPHGLGRFDGTPLYEYADPKRGWHPDWQTHIYDYGKPPVKDFLISNALYWLDCFHIDALRVDAVASMLYLDYSRGEGEWEPNVLGGNEHLEAVQFLKEMNEVTYLHYPEQATIAEESTSWPKVSMPTYDGGLGFGFKWNMGWMHDSLEYMKREPQYRRYHHGEMLFSMEYHYNEHFVLALSHDEVVHGKGTLRGKMPGDEWRQYANLRAYYAFMYAHPGKKLLFMGAELGSLREWNHDGQLDWPLLENSHFSRGLQRLTRDLNTLYKDCPSLYQDDYVPQGFSWVVVNDELQSVLAFLRQSLGGKPLLMVCNFTPEIRHHYRTGIPVAGCWIELLNTDAVEYAGSGVLNTGDLLSEPVHSHGYNDSLAITLPPLASVFLAPRDVGAV